MSAAAAGSDDPVVRVLDRLDGVRQDGSGWKARCPAHDDRTPSLSVRRDANGNAVVKCWAGCEGDDVFAAIGLEWRDRFVDRKDRPKDQWRVGGGPTPGAARPRLAAVPASNGPARPKAPRVPLGPVVARYPYCDEGGAELYVKTRHDPKDFRVWQPDGRPGIGDAPRVLYRLPEVCAGVAAGRVVWVVEGEKDADRLASLGEVATCNFDGAAKAGTRTKWRPEYGATLAGAHVVLVRDLDAAGAGHVLAAYADLAGKVASVRIVAPATTGEHDDVSDHLNAGLGLDALVEVSRDELAAEFAPAGDAAGAATPTREDDDERLNALAFATLPEEFWAARSVLCHIRQAAHARNRSADVLFYSLLGRLAGARSHHIGADTGVGSGHASLNQLVALVGRSGAGKSSGTSGSKRLIPAPPGVDFLDGVPLGSGEGLAEAYMGTREVEVARPGGRAPVLRKQRVQVRHNALFHLDEGQTLTRMLDRVGATVGPTLRSAWGGETLGQQNASDDRTRMVTDYSLGLVIGFQPSTVLPLLDDAEAGTPQRFLFGAATDPSIPERRVSDPGPLRFDMSVLIASAGEDMVFAESVKAAIYAADYANATGRTEPALLDSHAALTRVKVASLLALLEGRRDVTAEDWALALVVWETSCAVRDRLVSEGKERKARVEFVRRRTYVEDQVSTVAAVEDRQVSRVAAWVARMVRESPGEPGRAAGVDPVKPYLLRKRLAGRDKPVFEVAVEHAVSLRWVCRHGDGHLLPGTSQPAPDGAP